MSTDTVADAPILDQAIEAAKRTEPEEAKQLLATFSEQALAGTVTFDKTVCNSLEHAIEAIDAKISEQLAEILHHEAVQQAEGTWRGLHHLVKNSATGEDLKIKVFDITKAELRKDLEGAAAFDQSTLWDKVYEEEYGSPGGEPYSLMIGDFYSENRPDDISTLRELSGVAAGAFAPFISSAGPGMLGLGSWDELSQPRDLGQMLSAAEFAAWRGLRDADDARFLCLTMPRVLARAPYGNNTIPVEEFRFEEFPLKTEQWTEAADHNDYTWMNAAYAMGTRITESFALYGWPTTIRGAEGGGKVEGLPTHIFLTDDGDLDLKCPTEVGITDRREAELSDAGLLPLCHYKNTDFAVFFGGQSVQKPKQFMDPAATANAELSARIPYIMASSRIAHYLKVIARDKIGSMLEADDVTAFLNTWISQYVCADGSPQPEIKAQFPLSAASISVEPVPGKPGAYQAVAYVKPWLYLEELTTSIRLVAEIP